MAAVINLSTLEYFPAVNTPDYDPVYWMINPSMTAVADVPQKYWKLDIPGNAVVAQSGDEQVATDAALAADAAAPPSNPSTGDNWYNQADRTQYVWNGEEWLSVIRLPVTFARDDLNIVEGNLGVSGVVNAASGFSIPGPMTITAVIASISNGDMTKSFSIITEPPYVADVLDFNLVDGKYQNLDCDIDIEAGSVMSVVTNGSSLSVSDPIVVVHLAYRYVP